MDTAKLIEEAERWAKNVSESPGRGTAGEDLYGAKLLFNLAAALRETTARAEALSIALTYAETKRGKDFDYDEWARLVASARDGKPALGAHEVEIALHAETRKRAEKAERERDALAAANVAANKRIVELEQETDGLHDALRTCDESRKELIDGLKTARDTLDLGKRLIQALEQERDAARGQAQENAEHALDIARDRDAARAELARLTTLRPIAEAPRDGTWVMGYWDETTRLDAGRYSRFLVVQWLDSEWRDEDGDELNAPSHYLPLPEVKP